MSGSRIKGSGVKITKNKEEQMEQRILAITGTPGAGKTTLAKKLALLLKARRLNLSRHHKELSVGFDAKRNCWVIDQKKLVFFVKKRVAVLAPGKLLILDSHLAHHLPRKLVRLCLVLTCSNLRTLQKRLQKRRYSLKKIKENIGAEIFQVCLMEAMEKKHRIMVIDTS